MDVFSFDLPIADDSCLLVNDVVRCHGVGGYEQNENVSVPKLRFELRFPVDAPNHMAVDPNVERAILQRRA